MQMRFATGKRINALSVEGPAAYGAASQFDAYATAPHTAADFDAPPPSLEQMSSTSGMQLSEASMREECTRGMPEQLTSGAESLLSSDVNDEAAVLLALTTRRNLAMTSLSLVAEADTAALRLFGTS